MKVATKSLVAGGVLASLIFTTHAQATVIESFEDGSIGGFNASSGQTPNFTNVTGAGVTDGTQALQFSTSMTDFHDLGVASYGGGAALAALNDPANAQLLIDVTGTSIGGTSAEFAIAFQYRDTTNANNYPFMRGAEISIADGATKTYSFDYGALANFRGTTAVNLILTGDGNGLNTIVIDNIRAVPTPEPATLGLIGLAAPMVLRRRRKA